MEQKEFEVITLQPGQPVLADIKNLRAQLRPTRLYVLPTGAIDDKPSYCWEMVDANGGIYFAQITDKMLKDGMHAAATILGTQTL